MAGSLGATRASSSGFTLGVPAAAALTVEETRYLGGDLEHTHLVKGLDYALLHKARQAARLEQAGERSQEALPGSDIAAAPPTVHTSLGRAIHAFITGVPFKVRSCLKSALTLRAGQHRHASAAVERFAQGRVAFLFDLCSTVREYTRACLARNLSEAPSSWTRPGASCLRLCSVPGRPTMRTPLMPCCVPRMHRCCFELARPLGAFAAKTRARPAKSCVVRKRRSSRQSRMRLRCACACLQRCASEAPGADADVPNKARAALACEEEEDIFADAGRTYVCEPSKPHPAERAFVAAPGAYFGVEAPQPLAIAEGTSLHCFPICRELTFRASASARCRGAEARCSCCG